MDESGQLQLSRRAFLLGVLAAVVAVPGALVGLAWLASAVGPVWVGAAVRSRLFVLCGIVLVVCLGGLSAAAAVLRSAGASARARRRGARAGGQDGGTIVEFALVLPVALPLVLMMVQSTLLMGGNLCVNYAAYCAARSAIVIVPDNLAPTEPANVVSEAAVSRKMRRIQLAAVWAVLPVSSASPNVPLEDADVLTAGLTEFFESYGQRPPGWVSKQLHRRLSYAEAYTGVELSPPADRMAYGVHEDLRVTVRHTLYLSIPLANRIFQLLDPDHSVALGFGDGEYGLEVTARCALTNEGVQDYVEAERFPPE